MEKNSLVDVCNDINNLDIVEDKDKFIKEYKNIHEKITIIDNYLNTDNIVDSNKNLIDIIEELTNLNISEFNNSLSIEKIKYYDNLLKLYNELLINDKNEVEYV